MLEKLQKISAPGFRNEIIMKGFRAWVGYVRPLVDIVSFWLYMVMVGVIRTVTFDRLFRPAFD